MRRLRLFGLLVFLLALLSPGVSGLLSRAAMVTETTGGAISSTRPLRTLQVLAEGSKIDVKEGARLRLVYLQSGKKEAVKGPCTLEIGSAGSKLMEGPGAVVEEAAGGAKTKLRRSENIRRMGGSLQASADGHHKATPEQGPEQILAMIDAPPGVAESAGSQSRTIEVDTSRLRATMLPLVAFSADAFQNLSWSGGTSPFRASLTCHGEVIDQASGLQQRSWAPKVRYIPGKVYELTLDGEGAREHLVCGFMVLLPSERADFESNVSEFSAMLGGSERDLLLTRITLAEDWGLWLEALEYARKAVAAFPEDAGLQAALGRVLFNLGDHDEAANVLHRARALESAVIAP
jgi:hypothetical protein